MYFCKSGTLLRIARLAKREDSSQVLVPRQNDSQVDRASRCSARCKPAVEDGSPPWTFLPSMLRDWSCWLSTEPQESSIHRGQRYQQGRFGGKNFIFALSCDAATAAVVAHITSIIYGGPKSRCADEEARRLTCNGERLPLLAKLALELAWDEASEW